MDERSLPTARPRSLSIFRHRHRRSIRREPSTSVPTDACMSRSVRRAMSARKATRAAPRSRSTTPMGRGVPLRPACAMRTASHFDPAPAACGPATTARTDSARIFLPMRSTSSKMESSYGFPFFIGKPIVRTRPRCTREIVPASLSARRAGASSYRRTSHRPMCRFYTGTQFPAAYRNAMFARHARLDGDSRQGWLQSDPRSHEGRRPDGFDDFVTGWVKDGVVSGRLAGLGHRRRRRALRLRRQQGLHLSGVGYGAR